MTEVPAKVTDGWRTEPFTAKIFDFTVKEVGGYDKVVIEFEESEGNQIPPLSIFPPKKIDPNTGEVPGYVDLGSLITSLTKLGVTTILDVLETTETLVGIRTDPDICGKTANFDVKIEKSIGKEGKEFTNYKWSIISLSDGGIEAPKQNTPQKSATGPTPLAASPQSVGPDSIQIDKWQAVAESVIDEMPLTEGQLMNAMKVLYPDESDWKPLNKVRKLCITALVESGYLTTDGTSPVKYNLG